MAVGLGVDVGRALAVADAVRVGVTVMTREDGAMTVGADRAPAIGVRVQDAEGEGIGEWVAQYCTGAVHSGLAGPVGAAAGHGQRGRMAGQVLQHFCTGFQPNNFICRRLCLWVGEGISEGQHHHSLGQARRAGGAAQTTRISLAKVRRTRALAQTPPSTRPRPSVWITPLAPGSGALHSRAICSCVPWPRRPGSSHRSHGGRPPPPPRCGSGSCPARHAPELPFLRVALCAADGPCNTVCRLRGAAARAAWYRVPVVEAPPVVSAADCPIPVLCRSCAGPASLAGEVCCPAVRTRDAPPGGPEFESHTGHE